MTWLTVALHQYLTETTAHGISRLVGNRSIALRVFWAASFTALCVVCSLSLRNSLLRLQQRRQNTAFYAEAVEFEFPDVFVCGMSPFSASFSLNITQEQSTKVQQAWAAASALLPESQREDFKYILNSLPYQTLADTFGHRIHQMITTNEFIGAGTQLPNKGTRHLSNISEFYHPEHTRCARISFTETERRLLRQGGNGLQLSMMADALVPEYPVGNFTVYLPVGTLKAYPPSWNFAKGFNVFGESGLRMYFVQPGTYPAEWSTSVLLNPGTLTNLRLSMQQTDYNEDEFSDTCVPSSQATQVHFDNPYSSTDPYSFKYSYAHCYYRELCERSQQLLNCTPWRHPKPSQFAHLRSCDNVTGMTTDAFSRMVALRDELQQNYSDIVQSASLVCSSRHPCSSKSYSVQATAVDWPPVGGVLNFMAILAQFLYPMLQQPQPLMDFSIGYAFHGNRVYTNPNEVGRLVRTQTIMVRLFAEAEYSTRMEISLDYTVMNFFAEAGGFLGLYLGCSVLTLGELVELLHNVVVAVACGRENRGRRVGAKVENSVAKVENSVAKVENSVAKESGDEGLEVTDA